MHDRARRLVVVHGDGQARLAGEPGVDGAAGARNPVPDRRELDAIHQGVVDRSDKHRLRHHPVERVEGQGRKWGDLAVGQQGHGDDFVCPRRGCQRDRVGIGEALRALQHLGARVGRERIGQVTQIQARLVVVEDVDDDVDHRQVVEGRVVAVDAVADQRYAGTLSGGIIDRLDPDLEYVARRTAVERQHHRVGKGHAVDRHEHALAAARQPAIRAAGDSGRHREIDRIVAQRVRVRQADEVRSQGPCFVHEQRCAGGLDSHRAV